MTMGTPQPLIDAGLIERTAPPRLIGVLVLRVTAVIAATLVLYALLPIRPETAAFIAVLAGAGLFLVGAVFIRQLGRIGRAPRPVLAAVEALVLVLGLFLTLFAFVYVSLSVSDPGAFTQPIDKMAGIYFSITILATVGFGDIAATTDVARLAVSVQMLLDLLLIGAALRLLGTSARQAVEARTAVARPGRAGSAGAGPGSDSTPAPDAGGTPGAPLEGRRR
ncbi:MAG: potassium channel family protein [Candidatus Nanopelagicales bacterium]|jgi:hypothetical protein|nr:potassium channel family protein [Candidatus Nanopelagicales bacterium]